VDRGLRRERLKSAVPGPETSPPRRPSGPKSPASCAMPSNKALKADGPAIIDCVVPADELPNVPHLELETIVGRRQVVATRTALRHRLLASELRASDRPFPI
jgi:hypothetical protein